MTKKPYYFPKTDLPAPEILFIQHYNLLCDERSKVWEEAILEIVNKDDIVVELGSGTGFLSMIAARRARRVYSVEKDPHLADYSRSVISQNGLDDRISVVNCDARDFRLEGGADVIICEMLDTGLIKEQQIQVNNAALSRIARHDTRIIPGKSQTCILLSYTDFSFSGICLPLPFFETMEVRKTNVFFTAPVSIHTADLRMANETIVDKNLTVDIIEDGRVNSLKMLTDVELVPGRLCRPSYWFNPPLVVPVEPMDVKKGDRVRIHISYELGCGLKTLDYGVKKL